MITGYNDAKNIRDHVVQGFDNADRCRIFSHDKDDLTRRKNNLEDWTRASLDTRDPVEWYNTLHVNFPSTSSSWKPMSNGGGDCDRAGKNCSVAGAIGHDV